MREDEETRFANLEGLTRESRVSDVILALIGLSNERYLCDFLKDAMATTDSVWRRDLYDRTKTRIMGWVGMYNYRISLASVCEDFARQDGVYIASDLQDWRHSVPFIDVGSAEWRDIRDKWCEDYAAFLKEFGL